MIHWYHRLQITNFIYISQFITIRLKKNKMKKGQKVDGERVEIHATHPSFDRIVFFLHPTGAVTYLEPI